MSKYLGDVATGAIVRFSFNTRDSQGNPITLAGTPVVSVYKSGSTTEIVTGVTLTVDYDARTGLHHVLVDTSSDGTFYSSGSDYRAVITTGLVSGVSVVGVEVAHWSIQNRYLLSASAIAAAVWSASITGSTTAASILTSLLSFLGSYIPAPTAAQVRLELDTNSTKLANLDATITSRLAGNAYVTPPTADSVAEATAAVLFVDGPMNALKVNSDHSVVFGGGPITIANYVTVPAGVAAASQVPSTITCLRGDTLRVSLPRLGNVTTRTKLVMTVKLSTSNLDDEAVLQAREGVGLTRLNGVAADSATTASLTVVDATTGAVNLEIDASVTATLALTDLVWDVQVFSPEGVSSPVNGTFSVIADVTRAVV